MKLFRPFNCLLIEMFLFVKLACVAIETCIVIVCAMLFVFMLCFQVIDAQFLYFNHALHHVQCFLFSWSSLFYVQTVFVYEIPTYVLEKFQLI